MDTINAALEGVERLREQLKQLQQEVKALKVQLDIARNAAEVATVQRDARIQEVGRLERRLRVHEPEPTKAQLAAERRAKRQRLGAEGEAAAAAAGGEAAAAHSAQRGGGR